MVLLELILNYLPIFGDLSLLIANLFIFMYTIISYRSDDITVKVRKYTIWAYLIPLLIMIYFFDASNSSRLFMGESYVVDLYSYVGKIVILGLSLCSILFNSYTEENSDLSSHMYYPLAMFASFGCFMTISAYNLVYLMVGVSIIGICTSFMVLLFAIGYNGFYRASGIFILTQLLSFILLLFGIGYIYSITGASFYNDLGNWISVNKSSYEAVLLGIIIIVPAIASVCGAFPFTSLMVRLNSIPDCVVVFLRTVVVVAIMMTLGRFLGVGFGDMAYLWKDFLLVLGICGIIFGAVGTLFETEIEKITGYCSISHIGFLFLALGIPTNNSISAMLVYLVGYVLSYIAFVGYGRGLYVNGKYLQDTTELKGMGASSRLHAVVYGMTAVSYAGIPPFIVFIGKMVVLGAILQLEFSYLLVVLIIVGIFQCVWALRFVRETFSTYESIEGQKKTNPDFSIKVEYGVKIIRRFAFLISIFFLIASFGLINLINQMVSGIG